MSNEKSEAAVRMTFEKEQDRVAVQKKGRTEIF